MGLSPGIKTTFLMDALRASDIGASEPGSGDSWVTDDDFVVLDGGSGMPWA
ncbi:MAG: hypothetical protein OES10_01965 [Gammaproteobacteria bacterium]|nr:hypothetical protein [Gammaproteobacteria bacterium]